MAIQQYQTSNLASVTDPQSVYSDMARDDYDNYIRDFRAFEEELIKARNDTSLVDQAREDSARQAEIARGVQSRNLERYGGAGLSNVQRQEQNRAMQRGSNLATVGGLNNARIMQREVNQSTLADLINIGQGLNRNALSQLNTAAGLQSQRQQAYKNAKAQHSSNMIGMGGTLGSALLAAWMI